jgi:RluA family pseudouridine synthase
MPDFAPIKLSFPATRGFWELPVLFEDDQLLALNLPSDLPCEPPLSDTPEPAPVASLVTLLHDGIAQGKPWASSRQLTYLRNVNTPDAHTSGVVLLAKSKEALAAINNQIGAGQGERMFVAIVEGAPAEDRFAINVALAPDPRRAGTMGVAPRSGRRAQTDVEVVTRFRGYALLHCRETTNRQHQVRVHLQRSGLPVCGDTLYFGNPLLLSNLKRHYNLKPGTEERPLIPQAALHLHQLRFTHPVSNEPVTVTAPLPKDFEVAIKYLKKFAGL